VSLWLRDPRKLQLAASQSCRAHVNFFLDRTQLVWERTVSPLTPMFANADSSWYPLPMGFKTPWTHLELGAVGTWWWASVSPWVSSTQRASCSRAARFFPVRWNRGICDRLTPLTPQKLDGDQTFGMWHYKMEVSIGFLKLGYPQIQVTRP
jgi:hypothetical protein